MKIKKLPKELENTNQTITIDGNDYIKIEVLKDVTIAWNEKEYKNNKDIDTPKAVLIANIVNNPINVIDTSNIKSIDYFDNSPEGYGGNSVRRKVMAYDTSNNKLYDITERTVNEEKEKLNIIAERNNEKKEILERIMIPIVAIALYLVLPSIIIGLIVDAIVKKYKKIERKK